jgi:putative tryptophan/tyrosine transport system substrate-binding protein
MRRREFISLLGVAVACPLSARAQASPVIGILGSGTPPAPMLSALARGLQENGFTEGKSVLLTYRRADSEYADFRALAADLVHDRVAIILAIGGTAAALGAKAATSTVPIVC